MIPGLLHGKCISGGSCTKFCTSFKRLIDSSSDKCGWCLHDICEHTIIDSSSDKCGWCLHDICEHTIIGVIDSQGIPTLLPSAAAPQLTGIVNGSCGAAADGNRVGIP